MTTVWVLGSGECDQLGLGSDVPIVQKPKKIPSFPAGTSFVKIACGGLHTLALTSHGEVYSWGCNDDGALGREGSDQAPELIKDGLEAAMTDIAAGDSHSVAYNSKLGLIYLWGLYRNTLHGNVMDPIKIPKRIGEFEFRKKPIEKIVCGSHHTLYLVGGHVSASGEPENNNLGRVVLERHKRGKDANQIRIERIDKDKMKTIDVFAGSYHSFIKKEDGKIYSWGLNNFGQLGTGNFEGSRIPKLVTGLDGKNVKAIVGGESHSVAVLENGEVYTWGRNDEGQLGYEIKKDPVDHKMEMPIAELPKEKQEQNIEVKKEEKKEIEGKEIKPEESKKEDVKIMEEIKLPAEKKIEEQAIPIDGVQGEEEKDSAPKNCNPHPRKVEGLDNIKKISAGGNFTYALKQDNQIYTWGMGENYVLGNKKDDNEETPYKVQSILLENSNVADLATGSQHVVFITGEVAILDPKVIDRDQLRKAGKRKRVAPAPVKKKGKKIESAVDKEIVEEDGDEDEEQKGEEKKKKTDKPAKMEDA